MKNGDGDRHDNILEKRVIKTGYYKQVILFKL